MHAARTARWNVPLPMLTTLQISVFVPNTTVLLHASGVSPHVPPRINGTNYVPDVNNRLSQQLDARMLLVL